MKIGIKVSVFDSTQQTRMDAWVLQGSKTHLCDIFDALVALKIYHSDTIGTFRVYIYKFAGTRLGVQYRKI